MLDFESYGVRKRRRERGRRFERVERERERELTELKNASEEERS